MLKPILQKLASRKAIMKLTGTMLGRVMLRESISAAGKALDIQMEIKQNPQNKDFWVLSIGQSGANLKIECTIHKETLAELAELAGTTWLNGTKLSKDDILPMLQKATKNPPNNNIT